MGKWIFFGIKIKYSFNIIKKLYINRKNIIIIKYIINNLEYNR